MRNSQNNIPQGWHKAQIKDLLDYERPDRYIVKNDHYINSGTPVLTANKSFILGHTDEKEGIYTDLPVIIFDDFTTDSKYVDFPFKVKSSAIKILKEKNNNVDIRFVHEKMKSINFPTGSHKRYYISQYQNLEVIVPELPEQQKIAEILSTVDQQIQKTDEIISATERMKRGLMQEFFDFSKKSNAILENIGDFKRGPFGGALKKEIFVEQGNKVYEQKNVIRNDFSLGSYFIDDAKFDEMSAFAVRSGDVLTTCSGTLGKVAIIPDDFQKGVINQALLKITPSEGWNSKYVGYLLESDYIQNRFFKVAPGSAMKNMASMQTIKSTKIFQLSIEDQQKVVDILSSVDKKIDVNKKIKDKLTQLKQGLMQDLLSGRVRVNNLIS